MSDAIDVCIKVLNERRRQRKLYVEGKITHRCEDPTVTSGHKLSVLTEEVGEVARALNDNEPKENLKAELIQVAAVAVAWAESL